MENVALVFDRSVHIVQATVRLWNEMAGGDGGEVAQAAKRARLDADEGLTLVGHVQQINIQR